MSDTLCLVPRAPGRQRVPRLDWGLWQAVGAQAGRRVLIPLCPHHHSWPEVGRAAAGGSVSWAQQGPPRPQRWGSPASCSHPWVGGQGGTDRGRGLSAGSFGSVSEPTHPLSPGQVLEGDGKAQGHGWRQEHARYRRHIISRVTTFPNLDTRTRHSGDTKGVPDTACLARYQNAPCPDNTLPPTRCPWSAGPCGAISGSGAGLRPRI